MFHLLTSGMYLSPVAVPFVAIPWCIGIGAIAYTCYRTGRPAVNWMVAKAKENYLYGILFAAVGIAVIGTPILLAHLATQWPYLMAVGTGICYVIDSVFSFGGFHFYYGAENPAFLIFGLMSTVNILMPATDKIGYVNLLDPSSKRQYDDFLMFARNNNAFANAPKARDYYNDAWAFITNKLPVPTAMAFNNPAMGYIGHITFGAISVLPFLITAVTGITVVPPALICVIGCLIQLNFLAKNVSEYFYNRQTCKNMMSVCRAYDATGNTPEEIALSLTSDPAMQKWLNNRLHPDAMQSQSGIEAVDCKLKFERLKENEFFQAILERNCPAAAMSI